MFEVRLLQGYSRKMSNKVNKFYISELLDLSKYAFERTSLDESWDKFVESSPQGTVFASSAFLNATGKRLGLWKVKKNNEWVGAVVSGETDDGKSSCLIPYAIYGGVMRRTPSSKQPLPQVKTEEFRLTAATINHFTETYDDVVLGLSPEVHDMRPFLWYNYGEEGSKFSLELRYTSYVNLDNAGSSIEINANNIYANSSKSRRQEIRYGLKSGVTTKVIDNINEFMNFYEMTFARQGISLDRNDHDMVLRICTGLQGQNLMEMYGAYTGAGELASIFVFAKDGKRAYYLYGASHPDFRGSYCGTVGLYQSMNLLADNGCAEVDLEGINSPKRGYFKLSFGGTLTPYYRVALQQSD